MKQKLTQIILLSCFIVSIFTVSITAADAASWPTFRGSSNTGAAPDADPPITWSESENIKWKVEVPGKGLSSPVIWDDKIFFLTSVPINSAENLKDLEDDEEEEDEEPATEHKFDVVCMDRETGKIIWQKTVKQALPHEGHHGDASFASFSPVTDGKHVWASFGSQGLYCLDIEGDLIWSQELVKQRIRAGFGEGSSAAIAGPAVIVVADHEDQSYIYAFDKLTGKALWKKERDEPTSWATPIAVDVEGQLQVVVNGTNFVCGYDAKTGDVIWKCSGQTKNVVPTPVVGFGNVYCASGFRGAALYAIQLGNTGDLTDTDAVQWQIDKATPYVPSPILIADKIYVCSRNKGVISCYQAEDGKTNYVEKKLDGIKDIYASPVGTSDHVYFVGRNGVTAVVKVSDSFEVLATNTLDDDIDATPAIVGDEIYIKGENHLYCIAKQ